MNTRTVVFVVDTADERRDARHEGRQHEHDAGSGHESPDSRRVANERVQGVREGHCVGYS